MTSPGLRGATAMAALDELESAGIEYCVLRNYDEIPVEPGRDIDLIVEDRDLDRIEPILRRIAGRYGWPSLVRCRGHHEGTSYYFVDASMTVVCQLELHFTRVRWARLPVLTPGELLAGRVRTGPGIWVASDRHVAAQRMVQYGLAGGLTSMKPDYWSSLVEFARTKSGQLLDTLEDLGLASSTASALIHLAASDDARQLEPRLLELRLWFIANRLRRRPLAIWDVAQLIRTKAFPLAQPSCGVVVHGASQEIIDSVRPLFLSVAPWNGQQGSARDIAGILAKVGLVVVDPAVEALASVFDQATVSVFGKTPRQARLAIFDQFASNHVVL